MKARRSKARFCAWCGGNSGAASFCGVCYPLMDGATKRRMIAAIKYGSPKRALAIGIECLEGLRDSGVPMRPQKEAWVGERSAA